MGAFSDRLATRAPWNGLDLLARSATMEPTTTFDLLYRLRLRSNYDEADAFLTGALSSWDAEAFHDALCAIVSSTLLTVEIYLAHRVGRGTLEAALRPLTVPAVIAPHSVEARTAFW
jgi:hypothetical protein